MVKTEKIANISLMSVLGVCLVVFGIYQFGGSEPFAKDPQFTEPNFTDLFIYLMYAMGLATICVCLWSVVRGAGMGKSGAAANRVPGGMVSAITWGLTAASLVIGLLLGLGEPDFRAADSTITEGYWVTIVDMAMWSMYILAFALIAFVVISMAGIIASTNKVK